MKYYVSIKVECQEGFIHLSVYAPSEEEAKEEALDRLARTHSYSMRDNAKVVRVAEAELTNYDY